MPLPVTSDCVRLPERARSTHPGHRNYGRLAAVAALILPVGFGRLAVQGTPRINAALPVHIVSLVALWTVHSRVPNWDAPYFFFLDFPATFIAIAMACFWGLPAAISVLMFLEMAFLDLPLESGISRHHVVPRPLEYVGRLGGGKRRTNRTAITEGHTREEGLRLVLIACAELYQFVSDHRSHPEARSCTGWVWP